MEVLLFEKETFTALYNCSFYDVNTVPQEVRRQRIMGVMTLPSGIVSFLLYLCCITAMFNKKTRANSSYKLMILLSFFHLYGVFLGGIATPYLYYTGAVFCDLPLAIYLLGAYGTATWVGSTTTGCILSFNRCCEMYNGSLAKMFFGGYRVYFWMLIPVSIYLYDFWFAMPLLFSAIGMSWYINPHVFYFDDHGSKYMNDMHTLNNTLTLLAQVVFSITFAVLYFRELRGKSSKMSKSEKLMCLQVFIIGLFELIAGLTFLLQQRYNLSFALTMLAGICYFCSQACAPYVYLIFNRTIRTNVQRKFVPWLVNKDTVSTFASTTSMTKSPGVTNATSNTVR